MIYRESKASKKSRLEEISRKAIAWIGSPQSIIIHTLFFLVVLALKMFGFATNDVLLILTTLVSLEAIYLSLLNQMSINIASRSIRDIEESIDEINEEN